MTQRRWSPKATWLVVALTVFAVQYLTVSNVEMGPIASDTIPYGTRYSLVPLPYPLVREAARLSPVTLLPLGPVIADSMRTGGTRWSGDVMRRIWRFKSYTANFVVVSVINTAAWLAVFGLCALAWRLIRYGLARWRPSERA